MAVVVKTCPLTYLPWASKLIAICSPLTLTSRSFSWASVAPERLSMLDICSATWPLLGRLREDVLLVSTFLLSSLLSHPLSFSLSLVLFLFLASFDSLSSLTLQMPRWMQWTCCYIHSAVLLLCSTHRPLAALVSTLWILIPRAVSRLHA